MKKLGLILIAAMSVLLASCGTTAGTPDEQAIAKGVEAWNSREPEAAVAYWTEITDEKVQKKYLNYVTLYNAGVAALDSTDGVKNEAKLRSACNTALDKFNAIDTSLLLPGDVCEKGSALAADRINNLLAAENLPAAKKMYLQAVNAYGEDDVLAEAGKEVDVVTVISNKKSALKTAAEKAAEKDDFDERIAAIDAVIASYPAAENEVNAAVSKSGVANTTGVSVNAKSFKKTRQDLAITRTGIIRDRAYEYKDAMGEEFARQPAEGTGTGKKGTFTVYDIRDHYKSVQTNMDQIYSELVTFAGKYPKDIDKDILEDAKAQKEDLNTKIAQINKEIAVKEEIESRGKTVMPLMIGLFNAEPGSSAESKKSRPAKFSATKATKNEYWWGMVSIPKGQMNDLVITLKDNRTVRVFNQNTHSGKDIEKKGLKDLINRGQKVGNSWPVLNAGNQLTSDKYFFEIQPGKTDSYSGEVVVYSSFITRMR